jgi:hypothetical protein
MCLDEKVLISSGRSVVYQSHKTGDISSLRNYLMKYLAKTFIETMPDWTPEELVFNAIAWWEGYRFFGCSQDLSRVMKRPRINGKDYIWLRTSLTGCNLTHEVDVIIRQNKSLTFKKL